LIEATRDLDEGEARLREALDRADVDRVANPAQFIETRVLRDHARDDVAILTMTIEQTNAGTLLSEQVA
jgi:hypothetical protein